VSPPERRDLIDHSRHLVEVAEALTEDAREGFAGVGEDTTFQEALFGSIPPGGQ
jgi:hypothetical protein